MEWERQNYYYLQITRLFTREKKKERKNYYKQTKRIRGFWCKMATQETPELSSDRHTKSTPTHWLILSERNPDTSWVTPTHWANEKKKPTSKRVRKAETLSHHKPHPDRETYTWEETRNLRFPWGVKGLNPTSNAPTSTWFPPEWRLPKHLTLKAHEECIHDNGETCKLRCSS